MLIYWVWFAQLKGISTAQKLTLLQHFHDPEEIYHIQGSIPGIPEDVMEALEDKDLGEAKSILVDCARKGIGVLTLRDESYPAKLKNTYDPPLVLYVKGTLPQWETVPVIGIVGTRKASSYGLHTAKRFGAQIAACGALVVSGGASGIDTKAMEGALDAGWPVVGVLGCGVDVVYPASNKRLFARVAESGCLISEYPPKAKGEPWHFPQRNRIISGMSDGLLVVEAPQKSGALITAKLALEQGRDVYAVPGNVDVDSCAGSNALLQDRAMAALSGWDVVREYAPLYPGKVSKNQIPPYAPAEPLKVAQRVDFPENLGNSQETNQKKAIDKEEKSTYSVLDSAVSALTETEQAVLACVPSQPVLVDQVIAQADLPAGTVRSILTKLSLKGLTAVHPGGRISRK